MRFTELYDFITENSAQREYSCLMLDLSFLKSQFETFQKEICPCEVYDLEPGHGLEHEPHITILYGLHVQQLKPIKNKIEFGPVKFKIKDISLFENEKFDVLKFGIESKDLHSLNKQVVANFEHTNKFPDYKPHSTIAYLMPGTGHYYKNIKNELVGKSFETNKFIFSNKYGDKVFFSC